MELSLKYWDCKKRHQFNNIKVIGYFSVDDNSTMAFDSSQIQYYIPSQKESVHYNLMDGIENRKCYPIVSDVDDLLNTMRWMQKNYKIIQASPESGRWLRPHFVFPHEVLIKLLQSQMEKETRWTICAAKLKGTIYLCNIHRDRVTGHKQNLRANSWEMHRYGKFVQHCVSDTFDGLPTTDAPVIGNTKFQCIFQGRLGDHELLYSNKMDAVCSDKALGDPLPLDELKFIKLSTTRMHERRSLGRWIFAKYRTFGWWSKTHAIGVRKVLCGFTDHNDIVKELRTYTIDDLLMMSENYWNPHAPINFCNSFLTYVANTVVDNWNQTVYKFEKIPNGDIEMTELLPFSEYAFLPDWYTRDTA